MPVTQLTTRQIGASAVNRDDLDTTTTTKAVVVKLIAGTNVTFSSTGVDAGTGDVTINASGSGGATTTRYVDKFTATAGQTAFTSSNTLTAGYFDVFINGGFIDSNSYSATSTVVTLTDACKLNDIVTIINYATLSLTPTLPSQTGQGGKVLGTDGSSTSWVSPTVVLQSVEVNIGATARRSGHFTITGSGMTTGKSVLIMQAAGPYTNKGSRADEAEMDMIVVTGVVTNATTITCYWNSKSPVMGNFKFNYLINA